MLILLDIDGVMVPANSWRKPEFLEDGFPAFSSKAVGALNRIISETGASILLTTSHKSIYDLLQWSDIFNLRGIDANQIDRLSSNSLQSSRKDEILIWYSDKHSPDEEFVIIDDDKSLNGLPANIKDNLVLTSPSVGLAEDLADSAISILRNKAHAFTL